MPENNFEKRTNEDRMKEITEQLEKGVEELFTSENYKTYLNTMSKFHTYSFNNTVLIAMQKPDASLVAGYDAWQKNFNRAVKKGEHGIRIIAPVEVKDKRTVGRIDPDTKEPILDENGKQILDEVTVQSTRFRVTTVFDVSQTEGDPLPQLGVEELTGDVKDFDAFMEAIREVSPVPIRFDDIESGAKGYYSLDAKEIVIQKGMSEQQTMKTVIHETAHAILHDRDVMKEQGIEKDKLTREVEAESVAYTVCQHFGIDTSDYSFGYIAGWSSSMEMKELKSSMDTIRKTSADIIGKISEKIKERTPIVKEEQVADGAVAVALSYDDFLNSVVKHLPERLSGALEGAEVSIQDMQKLQDKSYRGICVRPEGSNIGAVMDMKPYYEMMQQGAYISAVLDKIAMDSSHAFAKAEISQDTSVLTDYSKAKEMLSVRIVNTEMNKEMLEGIPHTEMENLSVVYQLRVDVGEEHGSVVIKNEMLEAWGITVDQLHNDALENAGKIDKPMFISMNDMLRNMMGEDFDMMMPIEAPPAMYVAGVESSYRGASVIAYPGFMDEVADKLGENYYVIPSSVHEVIIIPDSAVDSYHALEEIIGQVNGTVLNPEDYLSDNAYHYDAETKVFELASSYDARVSEVENNVTKDEKTIAAERMAVELSDFLIKTDPALLDEGAIESFNRTASADLLSDNKYQPIERLDAIIAHPENYDPTIVDDAKNLKARLEEFVGISASVSYYVAESGEFPTLGEYHEGLSLEEALKAFQDIPEDRMNAGKTIGIVFSDGSIYDGTYDLMPTGKVSDEMIGNVDHIKASPEAQKAFNDLKDGMSKLKEVEKEAPEAKKQTKKTREKKSVVKDLKDKQEDVAKKPKKPQQRAKSNKRTKGGDAI